MKQITLSRRNLLVLLAKLDRVAAGGTSFCTIEKGDGTLVTAEEDSVHYANRAPGAMLPKDEELIPEIAVKYKFSDNIKTHA